MRHLPAGRVRVKYEPTLASIRQHRVPDWYHDGKLGIFITWGLYSVPGWAVTRRCIHDVIRKGGFEKLFRENPYAEWYLNTLKFDDGPTRAWHNRTFGADVAYEGFQTIFEAESQRWNPHEWAALFQRAGAAYVVLTAKHADGYLLWPSAVRNSTRPGYASARDLVGELARAVRTRGIRMGIYCSGGMDWLQNPERIDSIEKVYSTIVQGPECAAYANAHWRELIDRYQPSVIWGDIMYPAAANIPELFAYYYNAVADGVINDRFATELSPPRLLGLQPPGIHYDFLTPEYASFADIEEEKWETCRGVSHSFGYNRDDDETSYLSAAAVIRILVDVVSKNGNLLLNVGPRADGSIHELQRQCLLGLGAWLDVNGEAIRGTRPWFRAAAATTDGVGVRFTQRHGTLYAILLDRPRGADVRIDGVVASPGSAVQLLGDDGDLEWSQNGEHLVIRLPATLPDQPVCAFRISPAVTRRWP